MERSLNQAGALLFRTCMRLLPRDPRWLQLLVLGGLLGYGILVLEFDVSFVRSAAVVLTALAAQWCFGRWVGLPRFDAKSALITSISLNLLLRTPDTATAVGAAFLAIATKFLLRFRGQHVFNPANIAIVGCLATGRGWVTPGQWGGVAVFALALGGCGVLVTSRSARLDVTLTFLGFYGALLAGRSYWLGDPLTIPLHAMQSGALVLFAFFMISDPKTTPNSRGARIFFAVLVATITFAIRFIWYRSDGVMWALAFAALVVPVLDYFFQDERYQWPTLSSSLSSVRKCSAFLW